MRPWRHLRRLRARWRLHRIEWNNYYRPLQPPKGYEKYYTIEEALPVLKEMASVREVWELPREKKIEVLKLSWRVYRHTWTPDPGVVRILEDMGLFKKKISDEEMEKHVDETVDWGVRKAKKLRKRTLKTVDDLQSEFTEMKPELERIGKDRVQVMQEALREFSEGYVEVTSGKHRAPWDTVEEDDPMFKPDNRPLRYEVGTPDSEHDQESG